MYRNYTIHISTACVPMIPIKSSITYIKVGTVYLYYTGIRYLICECVWKVHLCIEALCIVCINDTDIRYLICKYLWKVQLYIEVLRINDTDIRYLICECVWKVQLFIEVQAVYPWYRCKVFNRKKDIVRAAYRAQLA